MIKKKYAYLLILLSVLTFSCQQQKKEENTKRTLEEVDGEKNGTKRVTTFELLNATKNHTVFESKYVIKKDGVTVFDKEKKSIKKIPYGTLVEIIGYTGVDRVVEDGVSQKRGEDVFTSVYVSNKNRSESFLGTVFSGYLGTSEEIVILDKELSQDIMIAKGDQELKEQKDKAFLSKLLDVNVITEKEYRELIKKESKRTIVKTTTVKVKDTIYYYPIKDSIVSLVSEPNKETEIKKYTHIGEIESLNSYIISGSYWEWNDYLLLNKETGEITKMNEKPVISPDNNKIATIKTDIYDNSTFFELFYKNENAKLEKQYEVYFSKWTPVKDGEIHWISNTELLCEIQRAGVFIGESKFPKQYIKITLKED